MVSAKCLAQKPGAEGVFVTEENTVDMPVTLWSTVKAAGRHVDHSGESGLRHFPAGRSLAPGELVQLWELCTENGGLVNPGALEQAGPRRPPSLQREGVPRTFG